MPRINLLPTPPATLPSYESSRRSSFPMLRYPWYDLQRHALAGASALGSHCMYLRELPPTLLIPLRCYTWLRMPPSSLLPELVIRPATTQDADVAGHICFKAFSAISAAHGFPCDLPGPQHAVRLLSMLVSAPGFYCVVAELEGRVIGSNVLDERSAIHGVGPITVDPAVQNKGAGHALMQAVLNR